MSQRGRLVRSVPEQESALAGLAEAVAASGYKGGSGFRRRRWSGL
jgi:hypothetical protein